MLGVCAWRAENFLAPKSLGQEEPYPEWMQATKFQPSRLMVDKIDFEELGWIDSTCGRDMNLVYMYCCWEKLTFSLSLSWKEYTCQCHWWWVWPYDLLWPKEWGETDGILVLCIGLKRTHIFWLALLCFCHCHKKASILVLELDESCGRIQAAPATSGDALLLTDKKARLAWAQGRAAALPQTPAWVPLATPCQQAMCPPTPIPRLGP